MLCLCLCLESGAFAHDGHDSSSRSARCTCDRGSTNKPQVCLCVCVSICPLHFRRYVYYRRLRCFVSIGRGAFDSRGNDSLSRSRHSRNEDGDGKNNRIRTVLAVAGVCCRRLPIPAIWRVFDLSLAAATAAAVAAATKACVRQMSAIRVRHSNKRCSN